MKKKKHMNMKMAKKWNEFNWKYAQVYIHYARMKCFFLVIYILASTLNRCLCSSLAIIYMYFVALVQHSIARCFDWLRFSRVFFFVFHFQKWNAWRKRTIFSCFIQHFYRTCSFRESGSLFCLGLLKFYRRTFHRFTYFTVCCSVDLLCWFVYTEN